MEHIINLDPASIKRLESIFESIYQENTVLLLGAGASVTNKKYLSEQIIEYYEDKIGKQFAIPDITKFIDVLENESFFDRKQFDNYVFELLKKLKVAEHHKIIASIPWRLIITTNYDLLIETAQDEIRDTSDYFKEIVPVRNIQEYNNLTANNEIKFIKLNGCMSDKGSYPFLFSTADFANAKNYYRSVLNSFKNPSYRINFLSVGYSFADSFAYSFIDTLDKQGYRDRRILFQVDPYINEDLLSYYTSKKICVIKLSADEFFNKYKLWEESIYGKKVKHSKNDFALKNSKDSSVPLSNKLVYNLGYSLIQLNSHFTGPFIAEKNFLLGEEPNFNIILKNYDVIKSSTIETTKEFILSKVNNNKLSLLPIFALTGTFGSGKSTITYRLIHSLNSDSSIDITSFEIKDIDNVRKHDIIELIEKCKSKYLLLFLNYTENDSIFKSLVSLRTELSIHQFPETSVFFIISIRENIFQIYKTKYDIKNLFSLNIDSRLKDSEIDEFMKKLKFNSLIHYRDKNEKQDIKNKIKSDYNSDSFISLVKLVSNGKHINDLRDAYFQLSADCKKAFLYTSLLHRFNILMPSGLLKQLIAKDWDEFKRDVLEIEGKGIFIQEVITNSKELDPDLYFKTQHPLIADLLIKEIIKDNDTLYSYYKDIVGKINTGTKMSRMVNNLLKSFTYVKEFSSEKIFKLYDLAYKTFQDDPFYLLNYCINLQYRRTKKDLLKALELLLYAESLLEYTNDRLIHRRGVINFEIAKLFLKEETELNQTLRYLNEAKQLFELKQLHDPCSAYSYVDFINALIWEMEHVNLDEEADLKHRIKIEELFDVGLDSITEGTNRLLEIQKKYVEKFQSFKDDKDYISKLDEMYCDVKLRPYACILKYNYYSNNENDEQCFSLIEELENYTDNDEVVKFLFKLYSQWLNYASYRTSFFDLEKRTDCVNIIKPMYYYYCMFVAESYNGHYSYAHGNLEKIKDKFSYLNPDFQQIWMEPDDDNSKIFEGTVMKNKKNYLTFKPKELQTKILFKKGEFAKVKEGDKVNAILYFCLNGIRAEIVDVIN